MFYKILTTVGTRLLTALITFGIVVLNAHYLGAANVGTIGLIILAITLNQLLNNFVGGPALVYLVPRVELIKLFVPSYGWALLSALFGSLVLHFLKLIPEGYTLHVLVLSFFLALFFVNTMIMMGKERVKSYNLVTLLQVIALTLALLAAVFIGGRRDVMAYLIALYAGYGSSFLVSFLLVIREVKRAPLREMKPVFREIFRLGSVMQVAAIFQTLNYRLGYYFIELFLTRAAVGVYSVGVQLSEGIWLVGRSISVVQYSRISNEKDPVYAVRLTLSLVRITFLVTFVVVAVVLLLPASVFTFIFGQEFGDVKLILLSLGAGIVILSISIILSPYFSGIGKPQHNTISSGIGLFFTVLLGYQLIPRMGLAGAGVAATASYLASTLYQVIVFAIHAKLKARDLLVTRGELRTLRNEIRKLGSR